MHTSSASSPIVVVVTIATTGQQLTENNIYAFIVLAFVGNNTQTQWLDRSLWLDKRKREKCELECNGINSWNENLWLEIKIVQAEVLWSRDKRSETLLVSSTPTSNKSTWSLPYILSFYMFLLIGAFALHVYFHHRSNKQSKRNKAQVVWIKQKWNNIFSLALAFFAQSAATVSGTARRSVKTAHWAILAAVLILSK